MPAIAATTVTRPRSSASKSVACASAVTTPELAYGQNANIERWAAGLSVPAYAIDDQTAIRVVDGNVEVVSEGHWKLFTPSPEAS